MATQPRYFTVEEANRILPRVRAAVLEIRSLQRALLAAFEHLAQTAAGNGHNSAADMFRSHHMRLAEVVEQITNEGVYLKDIERGLVDFPHLRDGEPVLLCWQIDEDEIAYWHDQQSGYAGRQPL